MKIPNNELMQIAAGISHIVLEHESLWSLSSAAAEDKMLNVRFSRPILKRPLSLSHKKIAVEYAKYLARHWRIELFLDCVADDGKPYIEEAEIVTESPAKMDDLNEYIAAQWLEMENAVNPKHIRGKRWRATIVKGYQRKGAA